MAGSPVFDVVRRVLKLAAEAARPGAPPVDDLLEMRERFLSERAEQLTRRRFLEAAAFSSLTLAGWRDAFSASDVDSSAIRFSQNRYRGSGNRRPERRLQIAASGLEGGDL